MPSTKEIRRRIKSIKSTRQITKAMELVSAAKMRRAQAAALASRTYAALAWELANNLSKQNNPEAHRLLKIPQKVSRVAVILITSNRGLIGSFNNAVSLAAARLAREYPEAEFITLGKKGSEQVRKSGFSIVAEFEKKDATADILEITPVARLVIEDFVAGKYDKVFIVNMHFISTLTQKPQVKELLPLSPSSPLAPGHSASSSWPRGGRGQGEGSYLFEPSADLVLEHILPRLVEMQIYQSYLETNAAEHSARMVAMKNASDAAKDLVDDLTLEYNQIRQAGITKEISEIVAGRLAVE